MIIPLVCVYLENKTEQDSNIVEEISARNYFFVSRTVNALCLVYCLCIVIQGESLKRILTLS